MARFNKLFRSSAARPKAGRKCRLAVEALAAREVPTTFAANTFDDPFFFDTLLAGNPSIGRGTNTGESKIDQPGLAVAVARPGDAIRTIDVGAFDF